MEILLLPLAVLVFGVPLGIAFALPHWLEGVLHLYAPHLTGPMAFSALADHPLPESTTPPPKTVPDGYRSTKQVARERPGFSPGIWVVGPSEKPHTRITVVGPRVAYLSVLPSSTRFAWIPRAIATVRVRLIDGTDGPVLDARALPACFGVPLSVPVYVALLAVIQGFDDVPTLLVYALVGTVVAGAFALLRWASWRDDVFVKTQNALEVLEHQLVDVASEPARFVPPP